MSCWIILGLLALAPTSRAQPRAASTALHERETKVPRSTYDRLVADAVAEHRLGHWAEARALFLRAHAIDPSARTLRALGMTAFELREYPDAVRELEAALTASRHALSLAQRRDVERLLERADTFVGRYRLELDPPHAHVASSGMELVRERDGSVLLPLGRQLLTARAVGYRDTQRTVVVDGSDGATLRIELAPLWWAWDPRPPPSVEPASDPTIIAPSAWYARNPTSTGKARAFVWTWVTAGMAVGLAGTSLALRGRALREDEVRPGACGVDCDPWSPRTRDRLNQWSAITLGASLALAASAVAFYFAEARAVRSQRP